MEEVINPLNSTTELKEKRKDRAFSIFKNKKRDKTGDYDDKRIESLDYDDFENKVNIKNSDKETEGDARLTEIARWIFTIVIGLITGIFGFIITVTGQPLLNFKLSLTYSTLAKELSGESFPASGFLVYLSFSCVAIVIASFFVAFWEPMASAAGVPEIKTLLNGVKIHRAVRMKTLICKTISLPFSLAANLPVGKVGPLIHIGGILGAGLSQGKSSTIGIDTSFSKFVAFRNDKEKRDFIACGTAAGVAASFGAPIGGMLFTIEGGASFFELSLIWRLFVCSLVASYVVDVLSQLSTVSSESIFFQDFESVLTFGTFNADTDSYKTGEVFIFFLMGGFGGFVGGLVNITNKHINIWRLDKDISRGKAVLEALLATILLCSFSFLFANYVGSCLPIPSTTTAPYSAELVQFYCKANEFNDLASFLLSSPSNVIKQLFHTPPDLFTNSSLVLFFFLYLPFLIWVYGMNIPGGNFVPNVVAGSVFGRLTNILLNHISGGSGISSQNIYALMGAASFLGGIGRTPVSLTIMLLECTGDVRFGLPLMVTLIGSRWIGNYFSPSLFDIHIALKKYPFIPFDAPSSSKNHTVSIIMTPDVISLRKHMKVGEVYDLLKNCKHNGFPVVDKHPELPSVNNMFVGYILRHHLTSLLKYKNFYNSEIAEGTELTFDLMEAQYPRYPQLQNLTISPLESEMYMDLTPYYNPIPFTIREETTIKRAYKLFRRLGLRHLFVLDNLNRVKGILTRVDFNNESVKAKIKEAFKL